MAPALVVEADGGSRGNPGVAGYGALVRDARSGRLLAERAAPLGRASNNVAEYTGLIEGLRAVLDLDLARGAGVEVRMDSKLVVEQMSGRWKIKHEDMRRLALQARRLVDDIQAQDGRVTFTWVPRDRNRDADALSNVGMDGRTVTRDHLGGQDSATAVEDGEAGTRGEGGAEADASEDRPVTLVLVRHGVTDFTVTHRMDGRGGSDPSLNPRGLAQARAAAEAVADLVQGADGPVSVVSSSLQRARQTGQAIADRLGLTREEDRDWDEQGFGDWDGRTMARLAGQFGQELAALRADPDFCRPGGESRREVDERVGAALERALARGGTVVLATHRVVIMALLCRFLGVSQERAWSISTEPGSLTVVEVWPDGVPFVRCVNDTHHLHRPRIGEDDHHGASVTILDASVEG